MEPLLKLEHINKFYSLGTEQVQVLFDINLEVKRGDFIAILGPSGSGKSTLMNIIGCMDMADSGAYYLSGEAVHNADDARMTRLRNQHIGFIFQKYQLIPKYDVIQNVILPLLIRGVPRKEAVEIAREKLQLLGMGERLHHKPSELSGGQQQRVSIARALVGNPAILLADEPTGALDSKTGQDVLRLFQELNDMGNTILMITHDPVVGQKAKEIVRIIDGRLYTSRDTVPAELV
ncbi:MAG: ABC transporter ATP-binding protein [Peptococcaceae bacterium]|nr:ABC transporter ATP-binding protein [Peptococcaceae bacterium]MBR2627877.1 ABC transporter ATP-binding protein [Peptococcaceae bacterium]